MLRRRPIAPAPLVALLLAVGADACHGAAAPAPSPSRPSPVAPRATPTTSFTRPAVPLVLEPIYDGGLKGAWQDWGWARHDDQPNGAARVDLSNWAGWQLVRQGLGGTFGGIAFRYRAPATFGDFLFVRIDGDANPNAPRVAITGAYRRPGADGWFDVYVPMEHLNPEEAPFEKVIFTTSKLVPSDLVSFDAIGLTAPPDVSARPPPPVRDVAMECDCARGVRVNPRIYGIAFDPMHDDKDAYVWAMGPTGRRWGGNPASRFNWELGNAWNTAQDWYWENVDYLGKGNAWRRFLADDLAHGVESALTVPMLGWVAKDTTSSSFPKSIVGQQDGFDEWRPEAGNGLKGGKPVPSGSPLRASVAAPPDFVKRWIQAIRADDAQRGKRSVHEYILDNEPNLWGQTHRDVHPSPVSYDELLEKTVAYASAIRAADPDAVIAGPAEWGWMNYFYSAKDVVGGGPAARPDRRAHGDVPLIDWYLRELRDREKKTGVRLLDVLDLHFYPQGKNVYSKETSKSLNALRVRSTRALWDPTYTDESWIGEPVKLVPRMHAWVDQSYPGRGISIGEWSFGGEESMSGGLAVAEALGRFGQNELTSAYYWTYPPLGSPVFWAFRAFRNFDGKGGRFEDTSLATTAGEGTSLFASRDAGGRHVVMIALNVDAGAAARARITTTACAAPASVVVYTYAGGANGFGVGKKLPPDAPLVVDLPPSSIVVVDVTTK